MPEIETTAAATTETATAQTATATTETTTKVEEQVVKPEETSGEVEIEGIEKDGDGQLVLRDDSIADHPIIYKGKDLNELLSNVRKGMVEKERYISELKAKDLKVPDVARDRKVIGAQEKQTDDEIPIPDREVIWREQLNSAIGRYGIEPKKINWSRDDWRKYADDGGLRDFEVSEEKANIRAVLQEAQRQTDAIYGEQNILYINNQLLDEETERVRDLLVDYGVSQEQFDYAAVLERVYSNAKNKNSLGVLKAGTITAEAAKEIRKLSASKTKTDLQKKIEEDIARGKPEKKEAKSPSGVTERVTSTTKAPASYEDAMKKALDLAGIK